MAIPLVHHDIGGSGITLPDGSKTTFSTEVWDAYRRACNAGLYEESREGLAEWIEDQYTLDADEIS